MKITPKLLKEMGFKQNDYYGKTEWYLVLAKDPDCFVYYSFKKDPERQPKDVKKLMQKILLESMTYGTRKKQKEIQNILGINSSFYE